MSNEYEDIIVHPRREDKEQPLPSRAILVPNPADASAAAKIFRGRGGEERFLYNSRLLVDPGNSCCLAGPCLGAPAAGLVLEKLIVLGVRSIVLISCCGAVDRGVRVGDVIIAREGVVGEGLSAYYNSDYKVFPSDAVVTELQRLLTRRRIAFREGPVWSTDAPYRERRSTLSALHNDEQVVGVDMEYSALCSIAAFRGVDFGGIFIVSDELWGKQWCPGFGSDSYKTARIRIIGELVTERLKQTVEDGKNV